jgi:predicted DNA-binding transcriptional regulator YafY
MRADRMVAILLMLQQRGRVTAAEVAADLEVSERTARRDLDALGQAGVPIYSRQGRGGGWHLVGDARTDLSGLTAPEARALFLVAGPASSGAPELRAALRKLVHALPEPFRATAEAASGAVVVDPVAWGGTPDRRPDPPHLDPLAELVVDGRQAELGYTARDGATTTRTVHPLGLARKGRTWYLLAGTDRGRRTFRVDRVSSLRRLDGAVERPDGFDLEAEWQAVVGEVDERRTPLHVRVAAEPWALRYLRMVVGTRLAIDGEEGDGPDTRVLATVRAHGVEPVAVELAGFGAAVEVLGPSEVRDRLAGIGRELVDTYAPPAD